MANATKLMLKFAKEELYSIQMCHECHLRANDRNPNWFETPCKQPHLLLWVKQKTYPNWPGKLMLVNHAQNTVDVRLFGSDHLRAVVSPKDCVMYSKQSPKLITGRHKKEVADAQQVSEFYLRFQKGILIRFQKGIC